MIKINTEQFAILSEEIPSELKNVSMETRLQFKVSKEHRIAPVAKFSFEKDGLPLLIIEVCCEFYIHPEDWSGMIHGDDIVIPQEALEYFSAQTVGTARGILHCKTEGTPFNMLIIPPVNVSSMINEDLKMTL